MTDEEKVKALDFLMSKISCNEKNGFGFSIGSKIKAKFAFRSWIEISELENIILKEMNNEVNGS